MPSTALGKRATSRGSANKGTGPVSAIAKGKKPVAPKHYDVLKKVRLLHLTATVIASTCVPNSLQPAVLRYFRVSQKVERCIKNKVCFEMVVVDTKAASNENLVQMAWVSKKGILDKEPWHVVSAAWYCEKTLPSCGSFAGTGFVTLKDEMKTAEKMMFDLRLIGNKRLGYQASSLAPTTWQRLPKPYNINTSCDEYLQKMGMPTIGNYPTNYPWA